MLFVFDLSDPELNIPFCLRLLLNKNSISPELLLFLPENRAANSFIYMHRKYTVIAEGLSDKGLVRNQNEDHILVNDIVFTDDGVRRVFPGQEMLVFAVADGLGGHRAGEVASHDVLRHLQVFARNLLPEEDLETLREQFSRWVMDVHQSLLRRGREDSSCEGMATTLCGLLFSGEAVVWFHAGDSRLYHYRRGQLDRLTSDHSQAALFNDPDIPSNMIANCIGAGKVPFIDVGEISELQPGDVLLLCTDGLSDMLDDDRIALLLDAKTGSAMVDAANERGGVDNISLIKLEISE